MSNFSFSYSVFKRLALQTRENQGFFGKGLKEASAKNVRCTGRRHVAETLKTAYKFIQSINQSINQLINQSLYMKEDDKSSVASTIMFVLKMRSFVARSVEHMI